MSKKHPSQTLTVTRKEPLGPDMVRIWFKPDTSDAFTVDNEGDYLKLIFSTDSDKPALRTYTVSRVAQSEEAIAIDFMLHEKTTNKPSREYGGFALNFALSAQPGDKLTVVGPNTKKSVLPAYENSLFIADATAIPALESVLRHNKVVGSIVLYKCNQQLTERLITYQLPVYSVVSSEELVQILEEETSNAFTSIWCAGEYQLMRAARRYASENLTVQREHQYFSSYWKFGMTEDGHKAFKKSLK